jgi:hypothetical protein
MSAIGMYDEIEINRYSELSMTMFSAPEIDGYGRAVCLKPRSVALLAKTAKTALSNTRICRRPCSEFPIA